MSLSDAIFDLAARPLRFWQHDKPRLSPANPRILIIRRNRMGDMIYTLPLLHALRRHFPQAHITVACDPIGAPIAEACASVNDAIVLKSGWLAGWRNAARLQDYDWVIAAKGGFDRRLARLARLTNAAIRIGFERLTRPPSRYYTDPIPLPDDLNEEHQIDTLLRLLKPLGLVRPTNFTADLSLRVPDSARKFASEILAEAPFTASPHFMLINLSSTVRLKFREEDFITLARRVLGSTDLAIGLVSVAADHPEACEIAGCLDSSRITALETPGPLELAALLEKAAFLLTPEGGAAHLAAAVGTPALVLWSEGPFKKWHSRARNHTFVHAEPGEKTIPEERVWRALQTYVGPRPNNLEKKWSDLLQPPSPDFMS